MCNKSFVLQVLQVSEQICARFMATFASSDIQVDALSVFMSWGH